MTSNSVYGADMTPFSSDEIHQGTDFSCAIKCQQLILNMFGHNVTEDELITESFENGWASTNGTYLPDVGKLLDAHGVGVQVYEQGNICSLMHELNQGHQVIVSVDSGELWFPHDELMEDMYCGEVPDHAIIVSGIDVTDPTNVMVTVTDPGSGQFVKYPYEQFVDAWKDSGCHMVATTETPDIPELENLDEPLVGKLCDFTSELLSVIEPSATGIISAIDQGMELCSSFFADDDPSTEVELMPDDSEGTPDSENMDDNVEFDELA